MTGRIVFQRHTDQHYAPAAEALQGRVLARILPGLAWDVTVVDNALPPDFEGRTPEGWRLVGGDNSLREISGWDVGFARVEPERSFAPEDPVLMVNDTFHRNFGTSYIDHMPQEPLADWLAQGALLGHVDLYPREIELFGLPMQHWIRTSFVLGRWAVFKQLLPLRPKADAEAIFSRQPGRLFEPGGPLSDRYKQYLEAYLLGSDSEYACRWHTALPEGDAGWQLLRVKTLCIASEHWLAARARNLGIPLRDVSGKLAEREGCLRAMAQPGDEPGQDTGACCA